MDAKSQKSELISTFSDPAIYFKEKIYVAQCEMNKKISENMEYYLVTLLCKYIHQAENEENCLALMLKKARESPDPERISIYKNIADTSLYYSGFFQDFFTDKCFDIKYYIQMGENAFEELSSLTKKYNANQKFLVKLYAEMSSKFLDSVDILLHISEKTFGKNLDTPGALLNAYDTWLQTDSPKLFQELTEKGVIPVKTSRKKVQ